MPVALKLILGAKNYSSWSLRPWLAMMVAGIPFEETVLPIYTPGAREKILEYSPSGKVPVLIDDKVQVWESLAIIEYAAERFPAAGLWPQQSAPRAHARAVAHEMHGGFLPLRRSCPMNMRRAPGAIDLAADALANVARIDEIWTDCRARYGGPFLFGAFGAADAMYAPVVSRFHTYGVALVQAKDIEVPVVSPDFEVAMIRSGPAVDVLDDFDAPPFEMNALRVPGIAVFAFDIYSHVAFPETNRRRGTASCSRR